MRKLFNLVIFFTTYAFLTLAPSWAQLSGGLMFPGPGTPHSTGGIVPIGTPTSIGTRSYSSGSSVSSLTLTTTAAIVAGNLVVVHVGLDTSNSVVVSSMSDGTNTYTKAKSSGFIATVEDEIWYVANAAAVSSSATLTINFTGADGGGNDSIQAMQVSGILAVSPLDQTAGSTGSTTSLTETTSTLAKANEIAFGGVTAWHGAALTYSGATGFTNALTGAAGAGGTSEFDYKIVAATTAVSYIPTFTTSGAMAAVVATFKGN